MTTTSPGGIRPTEAPSPGTPPPHAAGPRPWWRRPGILVGLTAVLLMGIGLRAAYLHDEVEHGPSRPGPTGEAAEHRALAAQVAEGTFAGPGFLPAEPLYPMALGAWTRLFGPSPARLAAAQALLGLLALCLTFWLGLRVASAEVGVLAAGLLALYGPLLHFEAQPLPVTLALLLHLGALVAAVGAAERPRPGRGAFTGLLLGLLAWARPWLLLLPLLRAAGAIPTLVRRVFTDRRIFADRRLLADRRPALIAAGFTILGLAAALTPLYVRNARSGAVGTVLPTRYALQLYAANHPGAAGADAAPPGFDAERAHWFEEAQRRAAGRPEGAAASPAATAAHYRALALRGVLADPGAALRRLGERALLFGHAVELRAASSVAADRASHLALRLAALPFSVLAAFGLLGLALTPLRGRAWLLASLGAHLCWALLAAVSAETRVTAAPVLAVAAAAAGLHLARHLGRRARLVPASLVAAGLAAVLTVVPLGDARRRAAEDALMEAVALLAEGRPHAARAALAGARGVPALALGVTRAEATVAQQLGHHPEAIRRFRRALAEAPRNAPDHAALARSYLILADRSAAADDRGAGADQLHEALSHLEQALTLQPHLLDALLLYARANRALGRLPQAEALLRRALAISPSCAEAQVELAVLHALRGELDHARARALLASILGADPPPPWDALLR